MDETYIQMFRMGLFWSNSEWNHSNEQCKPVIMNGGVELLKSKFLQDGAPQLVVGLEIHRTKIVSIIHYHYYYYY